MYIKEKYLVIWIAVTTFIATLVASLSGSAESSTEQTMMLDPPISIKYNFEYNPSISVTTPLKWSKN